jgi:hypothetical protein
MASSESEQGTGFVERGTACYSTGISGDASWPAGHNAQEVALGETWVDLPEGRFWTVDGASPATSCPDGLCYVTPSRHAFGESHHPL